MNAFSPVTGWDPAYLLGVRENAKQKGAFTRAGGALCCVLCLGVCVVCCLVVAYAQNGEITTNKYYSHNHADPATTTAREQSAAVV